MLGSSFLSSAASNLGARTACHLVLRPSVKGTVTVTATAATRAMPPFSLFPVLPQPTGATTASVAADVAPPLTDADIAALRHELKDKARVILGSSSSSRQAILSQMGVEYTVQKAGIDEKSIRRDNPAELVTVLSEAKADAVIQRLKSRFPDYFVPCPAGKAVLLITSDQVVLFEGAVREKPCSPSEAEEFIGAYSRAPAATVGALTVCNLATGFRASAVDVAEIHMEEIPAEDIQQMIREGFVFYCAGGLMVEHPLVAPHVTKLVGTTDAVMGLPILSTWVLLHKALQSKIN